MSRRQWRPLKGIFNPEDEQKVKHSKIGVWDVYEEITPELHNVPGSAFFEQLNELRLGWRYVLRMLNDLAKLRNCYFVLILYAICMSILSLLPALALWYSGQLLQIVESAVETRTVDRQLLMRVATARITIAFVRRIVNHVKSRCSMLLDQRIKAHYSGHIFEAYARLDVPTFDDPMVQRQLETAAGGRSTVAWNTVQVITNSVSTVISLVSQLSVLYGVLEGQRDGRMIALVSFISPMLSWMRINEFGFKGVWAATCRDEDYIKLQGLKRLVTDPSHRKELVAGNLEDRIVADFHECNQRVGDKGGDFHETRRRHLFRDRLSSLSMLAEPCKELPQILFTLRAVQYPSSIPVTLASLQLIQSTVSSFSHSLVTFFDQFGSVAENLDAIRKLYEVKNIPLRIVDGTQPFPENAQDIQSGISLEFRHVYFRYPGSEEDALHDVSFKLEAGQLCVIVGTNGSGKSTVLKLISRLYDPTSGDIFINGHDIKTLKLKDLRNAIGLLFQDYTHFPLSIRDNIGLGDASHPTDNERIEAAAQAGGAYDFIQKRPGGFESYLDRPVRDYYSGMPDGTTTLFGRPIDHSRVRSAGMMGVSNSQLSGGQMQRLAVSRTFMRSLEEDSGVGMLLFDEPSASLDPQAEHDLFERLRALRGNKTMIFSSHRFGNLTRHADLLLYMNDSVIKEAGTHDELMKENGGYADIYNLQARVFLS